MKSKQVLNDLTAYKQGMQTEEVQKKYKLERIIKLASNENPYGFSKKVEEKLKDYNYDFAIYPDGYASELRTRLARKWHVKETELILGNGSDDLITVICRAFLTQGLNTVMAKPTFTQYRHHSLIEGTEVIEVPTKNGHHDLERMLNAINEQTSVVWLCSPDNPSGTLIKAEAFNTFINKCPKDVLIVLDEAYYEFVEDSLKLNAEKHINTYENVIVLRTFSKAYGLAGLRIGYGISTESIINRLDVVRGPFNTSSFAQKTALFALDDENFIKEIKGLNNQIKDRFTEHLDHLEWSYFPSHANFVLVKTPIDSDKASQFLLEHGFIVRSGSQLGYENSFRVTIGNDTDMLELQNVLTEMNEQIKDGVLQ